MSKRIFKLEPDYDTGQRPLVVVPENALENDYSLDGYFYKNSAYDEDEYDSEDHYTHEYVPYDSGDMTSEEGTSNVWELIDGEFSEKDDWELDEPFGLYEQEWDGNNWKNTYYLADYLDSEEVTDEYREIFNNMVQVCYREHKNGNSTYYAYNERYFVKECSYWQGSGRDVYIELDEQEILHKVLIYGLDKDYYEHFPIITEMEEAVPVVYYDEGREYGLQFYDLKKCEDLGRTTNNTSHIDHYRAPDGREFNEYVSYWQGDLIRYEFV